MSELDAKTKKIETFTLHGDKVAILTPKQIIEGVDPTVIDKWVENIKSHESITGNFDDVKVIDIELIVEIETKQNGRLIGVTYQDGGAQTYEPIIMKDKKYKEVFLESLHGYLQQDDYTNTTEKYSSLKASVLPLVILGIVLAAGGFLTWLANLQEIYGGPQRTVRVKAFVAVIYYIVKFIGLKGTMILTGIAALACVCWMVTRMINPPVMIVIAKKK